MEYIYAAMLLHKAGHKVDEASLDKVLHAAGLTSNPARTKALVSALEGVDIDVAIKEASMVQAAPAAAASAPVAKKEDKKPEEDKKSAEQAAAGLGALFG